jgi:hypothetical protein
MVRIDVQNYIVYTLKFIILHIVILKYKIFILLEYKARITVHFFFVSIGTICICRV